MDAPDTQAWLKRFEDNARNELRIAPDPVRLGADERERVGASMRAFQIGEASEGRYLKAAAAAFARETGNPAYPRAIAHLIREENRHSAYLGRFMRAHGIALGRGHWSDAVFRGLRRLAGLETNIRVLVTAELVAIVYYDCLGAATSSRSLRLICERMLEEERRHVAFQMHHIQWINSRKFPLRMALADIGHAFLLAATLCVVWLGHRRVLGVRHGFRSFFGAVWELFRETMDEGRASAGMELEDTAGEAEAVACHAG